MTLLTCPFTSISTPDQLRSLPSDKSRCLCTHHTVLKNHKANQPQPSSPKTVSIQRTISPQTTCCLYNPLYSCPVKNPSLPASSSRQSLDTSCSIAPASLVCASSMPNMMHFPMRARTSDSHRGDSFSVVGVPLLEKRHCGGRGTGTRTRCAMGVEERRSAERVVRGGIVFVPSCN